MQKVVTIANTSSRPQDITALGMDIDDDDEEISNAREDYEGTLM